jgi:hypothetical protein
MRSSCCLFFFVYHLTNGLRLYSLNRANVYQAIVQQRHSLQIPLFPFSYCVQKLLDSGFFTRYLYQLFNIYDYVYVYTYIYIYICMYKNSRPEFASELYRPSDRRFSAKLVRAFVDGGCHIVSVTDPYGRILGFLDPSRYFFFQIALQLYSRG